jgi:lipooligosaccharide transport system permease protein
VAAVAAAVERTAAVAAWQARSFRRTWYATISTAFATPIFFLLSVGVLLGGLVDRSTGGLGGLSYLEFVAPGLLAATAMQIGTNQSTYPVMAGIRWLRTYDAVISTPVRVGELVIGTLVWTGVRIVVAAAIFAAVAAVAGAFASVLAVLAVPAALLCGLAFAAPITAFAANLEYDMAIAALNRFVIIPMFLFSGTFFPVSQLPGWLEPVAWLTPLWHGATLCRDLASGQAALLADLGHVAFLLALVVAGSVAAVHFHRRKLLA